MLNLNQVIDGLENRLSKLIHRHHLLQNQNAQLEAELREARAQNAQLQQRIEQQSQEVKTLRTANTLLGSDTHKTQTKLKINALVRELDSCIAQLQKQT